MEDKADATREEIIKFNASNGIAKTWPTNMDAELKSALDQDSQKSQVKMVIKKEEV